MRAAEIRVIDDVEVAWLWRFGQARGEPRDDVAGGKLDGADKDGEAA